jgi:hypothetical protein
LSRPLAITSNDGRFQSVASKGAMSTPAASASAAAVDIVLISIVRILQTPAEGGAARSLFRIESLGKKNPDDGHSTALRI